MFWFRSKVALAFCLLLALGKTPIGATRKRDGQESLVQCAGGNEPDIQCKPTKSLAQLV